MNANSDDILRIDNIEVMYDSVISALHDVSLTVPRGKIPDCRRDPESGCDATRTGRSDARAGVCVRAPVKRLGADKSSSELEGMSSKVTCESATGWIAAA